MLTKLPSVLLSYILNFLSLNELQLSIYSTSKDILELIKIHLKSTSSLILSLLPYVDGNPSSTIEVQQILTQQIVNRLHLPQNLRHLTVDSRYRSDSRHTAQPFIQGVIPLISRNFKTLETVKFIARNPNDCDTTLNLTLSLCVKLRSIKSREFILNSSDEIAFQQMTTNLPLLETLAVKVGPTYGINSKVVCNGLIQSGWTLTDLFLYGETNDVLKCIQTLPMLNTLVQFGVNLDSYKPSSPIIATLIKMLPTMRSLQSFRSELFHRRSLKSSRISKILQLPQQLISLSLYGEFWSNTRILVGEHHLLQSVSIASMSIKLMQLFHDVPNALAIDFHKSRQLDFECKDTGFTMDEFKELLSQKQKCKWENLDINIPTYQLPLLCLLMKSLKYLKLHSIFPKSSIPIIGNIMNVLSSTLISLLISGLDGYDLDLSLYPSILTQPLPSQIEMKNLQNLNLDYCPSSNLLHRLILPNVEILNLSMEYNESTFINITQLLIRTSLVKRLRLCLVIHEERTIVFIKSTIKTAMSSLQLSNLTDLVIHFKSDQIHIDYILWLLQSTPSLLNLEIILQNFDSLKSNYLCPNETSNLIPKTLTSFRFGYLPITMMDTVIQIIQPLTKLKTIKLNINHPNNNEEHNWYITNWTSQLIPYTILDSESSDAESDSNDDSDDESRINSRQSLRSEMQKCRCNYLSQRFPFVKIKV